MARFTDEELNRIKQDVSLVRLLESQGHSLKKQGKDYACRCPFHDDATPSLIVSPKTNLWHCMGACQMGGSVIDWVMKSQGVSFRYAVELLRNDHPELASQNTQPVKYSTARKLPSTLAADLLAADEAGVLDRVVGFYHDTLLSEPEALAYLEKRGLHDLELIHTFKLGFANRTLAYHIPQNNREDGAAIRTTLKACGVLRNSGHEHLNGSLTVPIFDVENNVVELYGRKVRDDLKKGTAYHLYLPGPHAGVWNAQGLKGQEEIILCEALIDAMTFWVHGFKNVTASYGTAGFTEDHLSTFLTLGIKRVLIAYDRDEAGNKAAELLSAKLQSVGIECFRVLFPKGMDANSYALNMKPARKALEVVIRKAEWLGKGKAPTISTEAQNEAKTIAAKRENELALAADNEVKTSSSDKPAPILAAKISAASVADAPAPEEQPLPASPLPLPALDNVRCTVKDHEILFDIGGRVYRVRGLKKNTVHDVLKISLMVCNDNGFHTDSLDLYHAKQRQVFINQACVELGVKDEVIKKDLGKVLLKLEALQEEQISEHLQPKQESEGKQLTNEEHNAALELLNDKNLLSRILDDFNTAGVVGEETNKLAGYLACVSRKLEKPLAVMVQSTSAAGKSALMDAVLSFMPEEERVQYSAMTGQSLFYMGETNLKHKTLAIAEEEGAHNASYALKLLQSEGEITIASTGKDPATGNLVTQEYRVEGPTQLFMTTTAIDIDPELMNRCLVLSVDEGREQTEAIHDQQRFAETLDGLFAKEERQDIINVHRNAQRLLKPLKIVNPYARHLKFLSDKTRTRRDHQKYLTLIRSIALLHQYQREVKTETRGGKAVEYIEVTLSDIEQANQIAHEVLGRTLDELPPQTRKLLNQIRRMVFEECQRQSIEQSDYRFSRKAVREYSGMGNTQLKIHCQRLEDMEYLLVHRGGRGQSFVYELLYDKADDTDHKHLMGLIDANKLKQHQYDKKKSGVKGKWPGSSRGQVGPKSGAYRDAEISKNPDKNSLKCTDTVETAKNAHPEGKKINGRSYRNGTEAAPSFTQKGTRAAQGSTATADWSA
ncbi:toprim domain-containing protein [Ketobacter sp. MCCC 1A13808]|uniref:CHC2 zinc finger domain-containing protein n=1 Tax=Ketobacter sp. MCCC 1A13808 TaxID=2602738 RepID=UPI0012EBED92|nr:CHC2 zinc finger domain-containing protein [Ketobacter sp. MCCC 1A13808]MVF14899.1 toprim domain-containing protein [Ketobacter sp. MCCC 1A13808]